MSNPNPEKNDLSVFVIFSCHPVNGSIHKTLNGNITFSANDKDCKLSKIGDIWYLTFHTSNEERFKILTNFIPNFVFHIASHAYDILPENQYIERSYNIRKILHKEQYSLLTELWHVDTYEDSQMRFPLILDVKFDPNSTNTQILVNYNPFY